MIDLCMGQNQKKNPFDMLFKVPPLARLALWSTLILAAAGVWLQNKSYSFDETEIIRISQKHIGSQTFGQDHRTSFAAIAKELKKRHPKSGIIDVSDGQFQWIWTRVGGLGEWRSRNIVQACFCLSGFFSDSSFLPYHQFLPLFLLIKKISTNLL